MIRNLFEAVALIKAAPEKLKNFKELLDYARNIYKETTGVFPDGIDFLTLKNAAKEVANIRDPKKVVQFPGGGKDKISPFKERPGEGELSVTIEGETKNMTPEGIMDLLMGKGKAKDVNIGTAPKTTKTKPPVDPELKKSEDLKKEFTDFENRNKKGQLFNISGQKGKFLTEDEFKRELQSNTANFIKNSPGFNLQLIQRFKKPGTKAYNPFPDKQGDKFLTDNQRQRTLSTLEKIMKDDEYQMRFANNFADLMEEGDEAIEFAPDLFKIDPPKKADGGRIGFGSGSVNAVGLPGNQVEQSQPGDQPMEMPRNIGLQPIFPMPQKNIPGSGGIKELRQFLQAVGAPELGMGYNFPVGQSGILGVGVAPSGNVGAQLKIPLSGGMFGLGKKDGGRIGFKEGTPKDPSKRSFIKLMGGLAALPFVGKFFKPAAKVVEKAAPVVQEGAKLGYENFMLLVDKIKRLGKSADNLATQERQKVTTYKGKDGSEYELVEDLSTGDISVTKDKPGIAVANRGTDDAEGIDVIQDRSTFIYRKGEDVVDTKTGKSVRTPDEYDEVRQTSGDGESFDGIDEIDDRAVNEVINELTDIAPMDDLTANQYMGPKNLRSKNKKASGGLAYMLGE